MNKLTKLMQRKLARQKRGEIAASLKDREIALKKKTGMNRRAYCRKYGLCEVQVSLTINGMSVPQEAKLQAILAAYEAEGV